MTRRRVLALWLVTAGLMLALPVSASAHAYLIKTSPAASVVLNSAPKTVSLTYDEAVEPRFAIVSVTDPSGQQLTTGASSRSKANPDTLVVPLSRRLVEGWYLVYWRAISVDGHPVQGAFTFAVGPNPGPAPQFKVPRVSATAVTPQLLITRWVMFLSVMIAIGLFAMRLLVARPVIRRLPGSSLHALSVAAVAAAAVGLVAIPVYLDFATANDSLRSVFDLGALVPLYSATAFGRAMLDLELCFALFTLTACIALWVDRPDREHRSLAELAANTGAVAAAAAVLLVPGAAGHASQTSPRGVSLGVDWLHLLSGSVWLGGLLGLLVVFISVSDKLPPGAPTRLQVLKVVVPRFSNVAFACVAVLLASGTVATIIHLPAVNALWDTGYGVAILVKLGLLAGAMALASGNLLRTKPELVAAREERGGIGERASQRLRGLVGGEAVVVTAAVFVAALLSSLAPPPPSFALGNQAVANVGPGRVARTVERAGYKLQVIVAPNKAATPDSFALRITKNGQVVTGASVMLTFNHLEMQMPQQQYILKEVSPGLYSRAAPALVMVGRWGLSFDVDPKGAPPFSALVVDQANG
ncbi:MAG: copper resistance protein CopC [Solirubrobacterales bacterium]|nr:copper resistance protein CopC [Solirubrobacterales bacterium]